MRDMVGLLMFHGEYSSLYPGFLLVSRDGSFLSTDWKICKLYANETGATRYLVSSYSKPINDCLIISYSGWKKKPLIAQNGVGILGLTPIVTSASRNLNWSLEEGILLYW
jgi:hypothetical protein